MHFHKWLNKYPSAIRERLSWPGNSNDELWEFLVVKACHPTERQQFVNDRKSSVHELCLDAVTKVVRKHRVFHLDSTQECLDNEAVT